MIFSWDESACAALLSWHPPALNRGGGRLGNIGNSRKSSQEFNDLVRWVASHKLRSIRNSDKAQGLENYMDNKAADKVHTSNGQADAVEITAQMLKAGVSRYHDLVGVAASVHLVEEVFSAMVRSGPKTKSLDGQADALEITPSLIEAGVECLNTELENCGYKLPTMALEVLVVRLLQQVLLRLPVSVRWHPEIYGNYIL